MHRSMVERVAAVARRGGDPRRRLFGIEVWGPAGAGTVPPPLYECAQAEGLEGGSQVELLELYAGRFGAADLGAARREKRNARLRERRLALRRELEAVAAERAQPTDPIGRVRTAMNEAVQAELAAMAEEAATP